MEPEIQIELVPQEIPFPPAADRMTRIHLLEWQPVDCQAAEGEVEPAAEDRFVHRPDFFFRPSRPMNRRQTDAALQQSFGLFPMTWRQQEIAGRSRVENDAIDVVDERLVFRPVQIGADGRFDARRLVQRRRQQPAHVGVHVRAPGMVELRGDQQNPLAGRTGRRLPLAGFGRFVKLDPRER